jgi:multidrug efflux pump subunit AcrA (membrane-fusion protein)
MKLKDKFKNLRFSFDNDRTFSHVLLFFFVMVLLTLIARGTAGAKLARVTVISPSGAKLKQSVQFYGTAKPVANVFITAPEGLPIEKVLKKPMDNVSKGEAIALIDQAALDELVIRQRASLRQMELSLESQLKWSGISTRDLEAAEKALSKAQEPYDKIRSDSDVSVEDKTTAWDKIIAAQETLKLEQDAYYEEVLQKQPVARTMMLDIATLEEKVNALLFYQEQGYQILSESTGLIANQPFKENMVTTGSEVIGICTAGNGFTLTFQVSREDANNIFKYKPELTATQEELKELLRSFDPDINTLGQDVVTFTAKLRETGWTDKGISITGDLWQSDYDLCIPMSALRQDSDGYFVYVMETTQTLMGIDKRAVRRDIFIENTDGRYAAVSGDLNNNDQVILSSSKPLSDGDSVRVGP